MSSQTPITGPYTGGEPGTSEQHLQELHRRLAKITEDVGDKANWISENTGSRVDVSDARVEMLLNYLCESGKWTRKDRYEYEIFFQEQTAIGLDDIIDQVKASKAKTALGVAHRNGRLWKPGDPT